MSWLSSCPVSRTNAAGMFASRLLSLLYTEATDTPILAFSDWYAAFTEGNTFITTRLINSNMDENNKSFVYCLSAIASKQVFNRSAVNTLSNKALAITGIGLFSMKRFSIMLNTITASFSQALNLYLSPAANEI
jgi:hypothetical protein